MVDRTQRHCVRPGRSSGVDARRAAGAALEVQEPRLLAQPPRPEAEARGVPVPPQLEDGDSWSFRRARALFRLDAWTAHPVRTDAFIHGCVGLGLPVLNLSREARVSRAALAPGFSVVEIRLRSSGGCPSTKRKRRLPGGAHPEVGRAQEDSRAGTSSHMFLAAASSV